MAKATDSNTTSRRNFLGSAVLVSAALAPAAIAEKTKGPDADLLELGRQFDELERRYAVSQAFYKPRWRRHTVEVDRWRDAHPNCSQKQWLAAHDDLWAKLVACDGRETPDEIMVQADPIQEAIISIPATTIAGLAVKARVAKFTASDYWKESDNDADWDRLIIRKLIDSVIGAGAPTA